jgi:hypothetical protein
LKGSSASTKYNGMVCTLASGSFSANSHKSGAAHVVSTG